MSNIIEFQKKIYELTEDVPEEFERKHLLAEDIMWRWSLVTSVRTDLYVSAQKQNPKASVTDISLHFPKKDATLKASK